ncbi:biopolymer transporter ExbD [Sulfurospirillum sp. T05]|uniref:Biopolymer transporter ExbD n=1 Tax=Sulfurospirillum tamanense TaxID=2813362 RepID=A0ABS2WPU6_9BACT|nr:biopolymer transporter ExbD [Sulfurospirillum tamanensis]MBN2963689.1 biopolymer transporter ExbD [Sulfurospirillum tamanensis]
MINWDETPDLNITPLVDVMLVLLAILMVTTPTLVYEENISLPDGSQKVAVSQLPEIEIRADADRKIFIKNDAFTYASFADNFILYGEGFSKDTPVYIKADKRLFYEDVMYILKSVKEAGFHKVALETGG